MKHLNSFNNLTELCGITDVGILHLWQIPFEHLKQLSLSTKNNMKGAINSEWKESVFWKSGNRKKQGLPSHMNCCFFDSISSLIILCREHHFELTVRSDNLKSIFFFNSYYLFMFQ